MMLTLVPYVGANRQDGATESAGPRLVIDVAISERQETGALGGDELALSGTHAHTAVHSICMSKLQGRAGLIFQDVSESDCCLLYTSPSPRDKRQARMPSSA